MNIGEIVYQGTTKKGNKVLIRHLQRGDEQAMLEYINTLSKEQTFITYQGEEISIDDERAFVTRQIEHYQKGEGVHLLVFCNEQLVGISGIGLGKGIEKHVGTFGISIAKAYRGEGIGKVLMTTILHEASKHIPSLEIVTLGVFANNPQAIALYEQMGFVQYGRLPKGIMYKGEHVDHIYMFKSLKEE